MHPEGGATAAAATAQQAAPGSSGRGRRAAAAATDPPQPPPHKRSMCLEEQQAHAKQARLDSQLDSRGGALVLLAEAAGGEAVSSEITSTGAGEPACCG